MFTIQHTRIKKRDDLNYAKIPLATFFNLSH